MYENEWNVYFGHNNTSLMGWVGSANNMKWVGCEFVGLGWVDTNGPMSMSEAAHWAPPTPSWIWGDTLLRGEKGGRGNESN